MKFISKINLSFRVLFIIVLAVQEPGFSQQLILNGSFEDENICTEFTVNCAPEAWISSSDGFSNYFKDANRAYKGSHCMALQAGHRSKPFQRTFIRTQLVCALRKGAKYQINLAVKSFHPILDSLALVFTNEDPLLDYQVLHKRIPSIYLGKTALNDNRDSSWRIVELNYTASGHEKFLFLGNFSKRDITGQTGIEKEANFFAFIDEITMVPDDPHEKLCDGWKKVETELYQQDDRHEFLRRKIKVWRTAPPVIQLERNFKLTRDSVVLPDVLFAIEKSTLQPAAKLKLDSFCKYINSVIVDSIVVEGHTDNTGAADANRKLSLDRAGAVADWLIQCKTAQTIVIKRGWGSSKPVADNNNSSGRQMNRRVDIIFYIRQ